MNKAVYLFILSILTNLLAGYCFGDSPRWFLIQDISMGLLLLSFLITTAKDTHLNILVFGALLGVAFETLDEIVGINNKLHLQDYFFTALWASITVIRLVLLHYKNIKT